MRNLSSRDLRSTTPNVYYLFTSHVNIIHSIRYAYTLVGGLCKPTHFYAALTRSTLWGSGLISFVRHSANSCAASMRPCHMQSSLVCSAMDFLSMSIWFKQFTMNCFKVLSEHSLMKLKGICTGIGLPNGFEGCMGRYIAPKCKFQYGMCAARLSEQGA